MLETLGALATDRPLMIAKIGRPELRRVEAGIGDLLRPIPLREILAHVLAQLHAVSLGVAGITR